MPRRYRRTAGGALLAIAIAVAGCASLSPVPLPASLGSGTELADVPFYPQKAYQCGPAALATVLSYSGRTVDEAALTDQVYVPDRKGTLKIELVAAVRRENRLAYPIDPTFEAIAAELAAGRPVLVLQNLGVRWIPRWHYAVVIGYDAESGNVILRSGTTHRRETSYGTFMATWRRSQYWGLVALRPTELPARPDADRYVAAAADIESTGDPAIAHAAYQTALARWPDHPMAGLGAANTAYALGNLTAAEQGYRRVLEDERTAAIAANNLATLLAEAGRTAEALQVIDAALGRQPSAALTDALLATRSDVVSAGAAN